MASPVRTHVVFYLNGERCEVSADHAGLMFSDYLRYRRGLTGTKVVCAEGDCGACSVLRIFPYSLDYNSKAPRYRAINSCIITVAQLDGSSLVTVEALAEDAELSPVQKLMMDSNGSQCGFCTPGFVVALTGLVEKKLCLEKKSARSLRNAGSEKCTHRKSLSVHGLSTDHRRGYSDSGRGM
jgi:xanthine dehydrogenase small subunit